MNLRPPIVAMAAAILLGACRENELVATGGDEPGGIEGPRQTAGEDAGAATPDLGLDPDAGFEPEGPESGPGGGNEGGPSNEPVKLSQAQAAAVLSSCSGGGIQIAEAVFEKLNDNLARVYAMRMIAEHTALQDEASSLLKAQGIGLEPGAVSGALDDSTAQTIAHLGGSTDGELNLAYVQSQVVMHRQTLSLIDCVIAPSVRDGALEAFMSEQLRPHVANHLMSAAAISAALGVGIPGATTHLQSSLCELACVPQNNEGLLPDSLRIAACSP